MYLLINISMVHIIIVVFLPHIAFFCSEFGPTVVLSLGHGIAANIETVL